MSQAELVQRPQSREEYYTELVKREAEKHGEMGDGKLQKFNIRTLEDIGGPQEEYLRNMRNLGVWGLQNPTEWLQAVEEKKPYTVVVGFKPSRFHVGHITTARELAFHMDHGGKPMFIVSGFEAGSPLSQDEAQGKVNKFMNIAAHYSNSEPVRNPTVISDTVSDDLSALEERVGSDLSIQQIKRLYGWDDSTSLYKMRTAAKLAAAFILPRVLNPDQPAVVLMDINQVTHTEVAKIVARKLKLPTPAYSHRLLLPGLDSVNQRMSVNRPESVIFLDGDERDQEKRLQKAYTGGQPTRELQQKLGADALGCSFYRIVDTINPDGSLLEETLHRCGSGAFLCGQCKIANIQEIRDQLNLLRTL